MTPTPGIDLFWADLGTAVKIAVVSVGWSVGIYILVRSVKLLLRKERPE